MLSEGGSRPQVQHQVKFIGSRFRRAVEINRSHVADLDAGAVRLARAHVHLVVQPNRIFRADRQTGIAAGAQVQVNRVVAQPSEFKRAQPARQRLNLAAQYRVAPLLRGAQVARHPG